MSSLLAQALPSSQYGAAPDPLAVLRSQTRAEHDAVEAELALLDPALTRDRYVRTLESFYGFWKPLEQRLASTELALVPDLGVAACQRSIWLEQDLRALGNWRSDLQCCLELPCLEPGARACGSFYVLEGAALGGRVISKHLLGAFGIDAESGARFFTGRGDRTGAHWQIVQKHLREALVEKSSLAQGVQAARETFQCLRLWLSEAV